MQKVNQVLIKLNKVIIIVSKRKKKGSPLILPFPYKPLLIKN